MVMILRVPYILENSWVGDRLAASQERLSSVQLGIGTYSLHVAKY
jgi:hypothetical protein